MDSEVVPTVEPLRRGTFNRIPVPFLGDSMEAERTLQDLVRSLNNLREDVTILLREVQDLKDRVSILEGNNDDAGI